jgi:hypothetical protein
MRRLLFPILRLKVFDIHFHLQILGITEAEFGALRTCIRSMVAGLLASLFRAVLSSRASRLALPVSQTLRPVDPLIGGGALLPVVRTQPVASHAAAIGATDS